MTEAITSKWIAAKNITYVIAVFAYLHVSVETIIILTTLMAIDVITGVIRSGVLHGWRTVTSHLLSIGVMKKLLFLMIPFILALSAKGVGVDLMWVISWAISALILSETYSALSNIYAIHTKKDVEEFDAMSYILERLRDLLEFSIKRKK